MEHPNTVVATFADHTEADAALKKLVGAGFPMTNLSVVGKGFHTEEKAVGFYNTGDRVRFWGKRGAFWGGLWGLFFGGLLVTVPAVGPVVVLGYLAATALSGLESAIVVGGVSAIGAALYGLGIPADSVVRYEAAVKADGFLVMVHGTADDVARAQALLGQSNPTAIARHEAPMPASA